MLSAHAGHFPPRDWRMAPDAELPANDPHGRPWAKLNADELRERACWCMTADQHEALRRARIDALATSERTNITWLLPPVDVGRMLTNDGLGERP